MWRKQDYIMNLFPQRLLIILIKLLMMLTKDFSKLPNIISIYPNISDEYHSIIFPTRLFTPLKAIQSTYCAYIPASLIKRNGENAVSNDNIFTRNLFPYYHQYSGSCSSLLPMHRCQLKSYQLPLRTASYKSR